jgi:hypothetical protein
MNFLARFWLISAIVLMAGVLAFFIVVSQKDDARAVMPQSLEVEFSVPVTTPEEGEELVKRWLREESVIEYGKITRLLHLTAEEALRQKQEYLKTEGAIRQCKWMGLDQRLATPADKVIVIFESGRYRTAYLVHEEGQWKVDVESFLGHHARPWEEIIGQGACETSIRALIQPEVYYNGEFADEKEWRSVKMIQPDHDGVLYGYVKRGTPEALAIVETLQAGSDAPVILQISRRESMRKNQYQIDRIIARGWLEPRK